MHTQNPEKFVVVVPEAFSPKPMNEVQKRLQAILDYWGPNGERWAPAAPWLRSGCGRDDAGCVIFVHGTLYKHYPHECYDALTGAAIEAGFRAMTLCSDSSFANARKMVLRAIELAE